MTEHHSDDCLFCKIIAGDIPSIKLYEDDRTYVFMDIMPQTRGHHLIIPKYHAQDFFDLPIDWANACLATAQKMAIAAKAGLESDGVRIMQLNGAAAGQTVFHYHVHVMPVMKGESMALHARGMEKPDVLQPIADKIIAAL